MYSMYGWYIQNQEQTRLLRGGFFAVSACDSGRNTRAALRMTLAEQASQTQR